MPSSKTQSIKRSLQWTLRIATLPLVVYPVFIQSDSVLSAALIMPALAILIVWLHLSALLRIKPTPQHAD